MTWLKDSNTHLNKSEQDNSKSDQERVVMCDDLRSDIQAAIFTMESACRELKHTIDYVNKGPRSAITSSSEMEPDWHDYQTCHDLQLNIADLKRHLDT